MRALLAFAVFMALWAVLWAVIASLPFLWRLLREKARRVSPRISARPVIAWVLERGRARYSAVRAYLPTVVIIAAGIVITLTLGEDFLELAGELHKESSSVLRIDQVVHHWAASVRSPSLTWFFVTFTLLGSPAGLAIVAVLTALLISGRHRYRALYLLLTSIIGGALNVLLKASFERARPDLVAALRKASGYSFPSGHAMGSLIVLGALAYVIYRSTWNWDRRSAAIALLLTTILTIGLSRIYLGVHWISDIAAGFGAGLIWLTIATVSYEAFSRVRRIRAGLRNHVPA